MTQPLLPPFAVTASYQKSQYATGTYVQGGSQVFSNLVTPPSSGVASEIASDNRAQAQGFLPYGANSEVQVITINGTPTGGTFVLEWGSSVTSAIAYNASALTVASALQALAGVPPAGGGTNEQQTVTLSGATGGTFTLTYSGQTTGNINYNATAAQVQAAIQALSNVGAGNVTVSGSGPYTVAFTGALAATNVAQMTATGTSLTGSSPTVTVATLTPGVPTFQNLSVTGSNGGPYTVTYTNRLANTPVAQIYGNGAGLTGGNHPSVTAVTTTQGRPAYVNQAIQDAHRHRDGMRDFYDTASGNHF